MTNKPDSDTEYDRGTQRLIDDLLAKPQCFDRDEILRRARRFKYHDYKADHPTPEILLAKHLMAAGYRDLAEKCASDYYAQGKEEAEKWLASESEETRRIANDPEMQAKMGALLEMMSQRFGHLTGKDLIDMSGFEKKPTDKGRS